MKHLFVINPVSGYGAPSDELVREIGEIGTELGLDYSVAFTEYAGHAREIVKNAVASGGGWRIYACGGDGTLNEVVNGAAGFDNAEITNYPRGTGNDFIKCFPDRNFLDIRALVTGKAAEVDCIDLGGGRYAINICSAGIDADIAADVRQYSWAGKLGGKVPYNMALVKNVIKGIGRPYTVEVDGERYKGNFSILTACSGQVYGGGFHACPDADPADGSFEFLLVKKISRLTVAKIVGIYAAGGYKKLPQYIKHITGKVMRIQTETPVNINYDGEIFKSNDVTIKFSPHKIKFILP
ncbi:MAG: diacylglycerol kinase family lipid kinase [Oscillospiraceae bacterium]|nr:diacylglycerol kinase family lipid kinase [Oscillospiraceae bacterium]